MPPKKTAAKKAASKTPASKKLVSTSSFHDDAGKDLRRAYEHLGRVSALHGALDEAKEPIARLTHLAEQQLAAKQAKYAADLLRAAEHLSFAHLAPGTPEAKPGPALLSAIKEEFEHKLAKAQQNWTSQKEPHAELKQQYERALAEAQSAYQSAAYRKALELVRAASTLR